MLVGVVAAGVLAYSGDYLWLRYRILKARNPYGTVRVNGYDAVPLKNGKTEFYPYGSAGSEVRALPVSTLWRPAMLVSEASRRPPDRYLTCVEADVTFGLSSASRLLFPRPLRHTLRAFCAIRVPLQTSVYKLDSDGVWLVCKINKKVLALIAVL